MKRGHETPGRQPDPTGEDIALIDIITKYYLGEQASAHFLGVMARGVKGDEPVYGHAVVIRDPYIGTYRNEFEVYQERLQLVASNIAAFVEVAGNVTLDLTPDLTESVSLELVEA